MNVYFYGFQVGVTVLDKNDVAPSWGPGPWKYEISEDSPPNTIVASLTAQDPDTIGNLRYSLVARKNDDEDKDDNEENGQDDETIEERHFELDSVTGQLRLDEALDRETRDKYVLRVRADDGIQHTDVDLIIQVRRKLIFSLFFLGIRSGDL